MNSPQTKHSAIEHLTQRIMQSGPIRFDHFMNFALYDPQFGYYSRGDRIFAKDGDFVTAPELTPLFGETLADLIAPHLKAVQGRVYEFGAGRGRLAADLIRSMCNELKEYVIVELSASLKQQQWAWLQQALTAEQFAKVSWIDAWPDKLHGFVIANELLDAMPVRRVCLQNGLWTEGWVGLSTLPQGNTEHRKNRKKDNSATETQALGDEQAVRPLEWHWRPADSELLRAIELTIPDSDNLPEPFHTEIAQQAPAWVQSLTERLQGHCLMIDYGWSASEYYAAHYAQGHLRAHSRQTAHDDFLVRPGDQDLTSHVNFTAIYEALSESGGELEGYTSQGGLLLEGGLLEKASERAELTDPRKGLAVRQALQTLVAESDMGLSFKAICWSRGVHLADDSRLVRAFLNRDLSQLL